MKEALESMKGEIARLAKQSQRNKGANTNNENSDPNAAGTTIQKTDKENKDKCNETWTPKSNNRQGLGTNKVGTKLTAENTCYTAFNSNYWSPLAEQVDDSDDNYDVMKVEQQQK